MLRKVYIGLPYRERSEAAPPRYNGIVGYQFDDKPGTDGDILEVAFEDGRYDPTSIVLHEGEE